MKTRLISALFAGVLLVIFVFALQFALGRVTGTLAEGAEEVCAVLSDETRVTEGMDLLKGFAGEFDRKRPFLGIFVSDVRIHEIQRALSRAEQLGRMGETSPALEALTDLAKTLRELAETHRPCWENIL